MNVSLPLQKRGTVVVGMQLTLYKHSKSAVQSFPSISGLYYVNEDHIRFVLRWYFVNAVVPTSLSFLVLTES